MKFITILFLSALLTACDKASIQTQKLAVEKEHLPEKKHIAIVEQYAKAHLNDTMKSVSKGTVANGSLVNGKLFPFQGENFVYFDQNSYLKGRAFLNGLLKDAVLQTYDSLLSLYPLRQFTIMECSLKNGGELFPHRTHQNGLSIDFMMPKLKEGTPFYGLDSLGASHYWLNFDSNGRYVKDTNIHIDFELIAHHLLLLNASAKNYSLRVKKVIINTSMKQSLFMGKYGQMLKNSDIYIVQKLSPMLNALHDEHYHVDFDLYNVEK